MSYFATPCARNLEVDELLQRLAVSVDLGHQRPNDLIAKMEELHDVRTLKSNGYVGLHRAPFTEVVLESDAQDMEINARLNTVAGLVSDNNKALTALADKTSSDKKRAWFGYGVSAHKPTLDAELHLEVQLGSTDDAPIVSLPFSPQSRGLLVTFNPDYSPHNLPIPKRYYSNLKMLDELNSLGFFFGQGPDQSAVPWARGEKLLVIRREHGKWTDPRSIEMPEIDGPCPERFDCLNLYNIGIRIVSSIEGGGMASGVRSANASGSPTGFALVGMRLPAIENKLLAMQLQTCQLPCTHRQHIAIAEFQGANAFRLDRSDGFDSRNGIVTRFERLPDEREFLLWKKPAGNASVADFWGFFPFRPMTPPRTMVDRLRQRIKLTHKTRWGWRYPSTLIERARYEPNPLSDTGLPDLCEEFFHELPESSRKHVNFNKIADVGGLLLVPRGQKHW